MLARTSVLIAPFSRDRDRADLHLVKGKNQQLTSASDFQQEQYQVKAVKELPL